ncbi:MAG TPA: hypothetical protein VFC96_00210 [Anaerovoracaceae bacterium]|nr:hypothetical protein [Anaerovoracaceae bacterium]
MELAVKTLKTGFIKAITTTLTLMKVVLPVYALVVVIKYSPIMALLQKVFEPAMGIFSLPSTAAIPIITGIFTDEYGAIATATQFDFTMWQLTTIAMINLVCHGLPVEYALSKKIGLPAGRFVAYRVVSAVLIGLIISWIGGVLL